MLLNKFRQSFNSVSKNRSPRLSYLAASQKPKMFVAAPPSQMISGRKFSSEAGSGEEEDEAEVMEYDVLIVGGGPAGKF